MRGVEPLERLQSGKFKKGCKKRESTWDSITGSLLAIVMEGGGQEKICCITKRNVVGA